MGRWIKPEIYPLFAAIGTALGLCGFAMGRNLVINPDVRINKEDREAGLLDNHKEGKAYKDHAFRKFLENRKPEIFPSLNAYFTGKESADSHS